jgi:hypothetical protein
MSHPRTPKLHLERFSRICWILLLYWYDFFYILAPSARPLCKIFAIVLIHQDTYPMKTVQGIFSQFECMVTSTFLFLFLFFSKVDFFRFGRICAQRPLETVSSNVSSRSRYERSTLCHVYRLWTQDVQLGVTNLDKKLIQTKE